MKKFMLYFSLTLSAIALVIAIIILSNPLRRSEETIRDRLLELTPIGMSMEDVIKVIESNKSWQIVSISHKFGYVRPGPPDPADYASGKMTIIGEKSIRVSLGEYRGFWLVSVTAFWGFDKDANLIDVYVWKVGDAL